MGRFRRILLVNPVATYERGHVGAVRLQPALVSIRSFLAAHDVPVDVLDLHVEMRSAAEYPAETLASRSLERVLRYDFDVLAISCNSSFQYLGALDLAVGVRYQDASVTIVVGGSHATVAPDDFCMPGTPFDVVVRGEGELTLLDLAGRRTRRREEPDVVSGRPLPLDQAFVDLTGYPYWVERPHTLQFPLSRGCPFQCTFCGGIERRSWRAYPPAVALEVVRKMSAAGPEVLVFSDACFALRSSWRHEFLVGLKQLALPQAFLVETRVEALADDDADLFAGLDVQLDLGVETASPGGPHGQDPRRRDLRAAHDGAPRSLGPARRP